jgi:hypothetical protein
MQKLLFLVAAIVLLFGLNGCANDIDNVKDGVMDFDKTLTVGEAFDNWKACNKSQWNSFETDNGIKVVEFKCEEDMRNKSKEMIEFVKKINAEKNTQNRNSIYSIYYDLGDNYSPLSMTSKITSFQWTINKDNTFQLDNVQAERRWEDGTKNKWSEKPMEAMKAVYSNKVVDLYGDQVIASYSVGRLN